MPTDKKAPASVALPDVATLKGAVTISRDQSKNKIYEEIKEKSMSNERRYVHLIGLQDHYKHKGRWSLFISFLMFILVIFQCALLGLVGSGVWTFEAYKWLLPALLVQNFGQVVGLAIIVVKALFKDIKD